MYLEKISKRDIVMGNYCLFMRLIWFDLQFVYSGILSVSDGSAYHLKMVGRSGVINLPDSS